MSACRVVCVLRSGGAYTAEYVDRLRSGVGKHLPAVPFFCLADIGGFICERIPLKHDWPGWWAKMELFRPDISGDLLYFDLDTVIVGGLELIVSAAKRMTMLSDFYAPERLASGMMFLPEDSRAIVWRHWIADSARIMADCGAYGDGMAIAMAMLGRRVDRWQSIVPGAVVSYKMHVRKREAARDKGNGKLPKGARVVCFHGLPRPREVGWTPWVAAA